MRAALELGRWTFLALLGCLNAHRSTGRSLIPDPERAPLVRRAFQDFATGRFTKDEIRKSVIALGLKTRRGKPVPSQTFDAMLRNRVYIGRIDVPDFGISRRGDFEPHVGEDCLKCLVANAEPDPDFKYFSNRTACSSLANATTTITRHGRPVAVCGQRPSLCAASRVLTFAVRPV
jgi:hypothetical protein